MHKAGFRVLEPQQLTSSVVFASPHSGREYSWSFRRRSALNELALRSSEDAFVDRLIIDAPDLGSPLLLADTPRAYVDFNRNHDELDPALIEGLARKAHNPRVASGLGVVPRVVANGRCIYRGKLSMQEVQTRIDQHWHPYHDALQSLLTQAHGAFGKAVLIDVHSMPREALDGVVRRGQIRPDIVIGDRFGAAANQSLVEQVEAAFSSAGFTVARNSPFAGAYIAQTYGRPSRQQHAIQIEIDRSLYMCESSITPNADFPKVRRAFSRAMSEIVSIGRSGTATPLAAE